MKEQLNSGDKKRLTLKDLSGAFVVLGVGYAIGLTVFIMEIYWGRILKNKKAAALGNENPKSNANNKPPTKIKLKTPGKVIQLEPVKLDEATAAKP